MLDRDDPDWTSHGLAEDGFDGFIRFADLPTSDVPTDPGVYVVLRADTGAQSYLERSVAGLFKGKGPTVAVSKLKEAWVPDAVVLYIGKAGAGASGKRGLRKRLDEYRQHGEGKPVGHWGGRYIWQLAESDRLLVAWKPTPSIEPGLVESKLLSRFVDSFGALPFANRKRGDDVSP